MIRRGLFGVLTTAVIGLGVLGMVPGVPRAGGAAAKASVVDLPASIDRSGKRDVTAALNAFLGTVAAGTTVNFPDRGRFRAEGIVFLERRRDVTIEGHGSTLEATTDGRGSAPPTYQYRSKWPRSRAQVVIRGSSNVTIRELTVVGPNQAGVFRPEFEAQAGFVVSGSQQVDLDGVTARSTYGDGIYIVTGSQDVTVRNCTLDHNGRQGVAVVGGQRITVGGCAISAPGRSAIDLEPAHGLVRTVHIRDNRVRGYTNFLLAAVGAGVGVQDVWLERNRVSGGRGVSLFVGVANATRTGIHVIDNTGEGTSSGFEGVQMRFGRFDGIEVRGNHQTVADGVTPVLLLNSCNATVTHNDFGRVAPSDIVKTDGDCTTAPPARVLPHSRVPKPRAVPPGRLRTRARRPTTTTSVAPVPIAVVTRPRSRETSPVSLVIGIGVGALAGIGGTLLTQWARRNRPL